MAPNLLVKASYRLIYIYDLLKLESGYYVLACTNKNFIPCKITKLDLASEEKGNDYYI